jgi:uncharacterized membrane protein
MKKIFCFAVMLCIFSVAVLAEEGKMEVYSFKAYSGDDSLNVEWDDDNFEMYVGDTMQVQIRLQNNYNVTVDVEIETTLFDISDDITRDKTISIASGDKKSIVLDYPIPSTTRTGTYDYEFTYWYETLNGTVKKKYTHTKTFEIDTRKRTVNEDEVTLQQPDHADS